MRRAQLEPGQKAVVIGGGPIGVLIATVAREFGGDVVVIELDAKRRRADRRARVHDDRSAWRPIRSPGSRSGPAGAGADVVFEVSGAAAAVLGATALAKVRGTLVVVAIHPVPREIDLQRLFWRELSILGARVYQRADFETAVELLDRRPHPGGLLITEIVPLSEIARAFDDLENGRAMKILVDVGGAA